MFYAVDQVLENNSSIFSSLEELVTAHAEFKARFAIIDNYRQVQETDNSGLTTKKADLRQQLMNFVQRALAALNAYALITNDAELKAKCAYTPSRLAIKSDPVFSDIAKLIYDLAVSNIDQLGKFFLTQEDLDSMHALNMQFKAAIPQKRVASSVQKVSTLNIGQTIRDLDKFLKETLDVLVAPFEFMQADFYHAYRNARTIIDYHGGGRKGGENPDDQAA